MDEQEIPEMLGCEDCGEWYHAECVMLDEKQMKKFLNTRKQDSDVECCYYEYNEKTVIFHRYIGMLI